MEYLTYESIFGRLVKSAYEGELEQEIKELNPDNDSKMSGYISLAAGKGDRDKVVYKVSDCYDADGCGGKCQVACLFHAIERDEQGNVVIKDDYCTHCGECVKVCNHGHFIDKKEFVPLIKVLRDKKVPVFAIVAPAFIGQFGPEVTPGKLRSALKRLGFYGMVEVALFADMLTLKEALEFDLHVQKEGDFVLTSCCCPMWVAMIKKVYAQLASHISPSVSPMIACGRGIKKLHPDAKVVFVGPCIAKKAEAKEVDVKDAVDVVITFRELQEIFNAVGIQPEEMPENESEHSSKAGRTYAYTGGVSEAVKETLERIRPEKKIPLIAVQADGIRECKKILQQALEGKINANFYEGMGCKGGCIGGPKAVIDAETNKKCVENYGEEADNNTPADNQYVLELLKALGIQEIHELLEGEKASMFQRKFI